MPCSASDRTLPRPGGDVGVAPGAELRIEVRLTPRAGVDRIDGLDGGVLRCRVAAPPVAGAANDALLRLVAHELDLPRAAVRLVTGEHGRRKVLGLPAERRSTVVARWPGLID